MQAIQPKKIPRDIFADARRYLVIGIMAKMATPRAGRYWSLLPGRTHDHLNFPIKGTCLSMPGCGADDTNLEIPFRVSDNLPIGRMIGRFNSNNSTADCWVLFANIFGELNFRTGRSKDQDFAGRADSIQNLA
jgi:hypothetical protein